MEEYQPLSATATAEGAAMAVFSEIYCNGGGAPISMVRWRLSGGLSLASVELPEGEHIVEWRFRAPHWSVVEG